MWKHSLRSEPERLIAGARALSARLQDEMMPPPPPQVGSAIGSSHQGHVATCGLWGTQPPPPTLPQEGLVNPFVQQGVLSIGSIGFVDLAGSSSAAGSGSVELSSSACATACSCAARTPSEAATGASTAVDAATRTNDAPSAAADTSSRSDLPACGEPGAGSCAGSTVERGRRSPSNIDSHAPVSTLVDENGTPRLGMTYDSA